MKSRYNYDGENADEIMEAHYLEMQADHRSHRELESELQWAYYEIRNKDEYIKALTQKYTALSHLYWEVT